MDREGFLAVRSTIAKVFDLDARLPGQVFADDLGDALFCEFDVLLAPDLWPAMQTMARWHGDEQIDLLVPAPDTDEFYQREHGMYPAASLPVDGDEDDYWDAVGFDSTPDIMSSIHFSAEVVAITGKSGKWGVWGERGPEVAVFRGFPDAASREEWRKSYGPFLDASEALQSYISRAFRDRIVPADYAAALLENYRP
jgi:hypothetical protein